LIHPTRTQARNKHFKDPLFSLSRDQTCPKIRENREIEARISQVKSDHILPIDALTNRVSRLPIREIFDILQAETSAKRQGASAGRPLDENKSANSSSA
jgi:hypothetical protein